MVVQEVEHEFLAQQRGILEAVVEHEFLQPIMGLAQSILFKINAKGFFSARIVVGRVSLEFYAGLRIRLPVN